MKTWKVMIVIEGLGGIFKREHLIKAKTEKSAMSKAYAMIGNQTGFVESMVPA
jgi:hypothetical protein